MKSPPKRKLWSRDELLLAMNLYCRIPFGRQHSRAPEVIELARSLGRTPGSVAMKLNNFTSLDPKEAARGVRGLSSMSRLDKHVWEEFNRDWEKLATESEKLWLEKVSSKDIDSSLSGFNGNQKKYKNTGQNKTPFVENVPTGPTEGEKMVKVRYAQQFFRRTVLTAYGFRCCISGIPIPKLLIASHILPWSQYPEHRINPRNGLCLSRLHDAAFDQGLITFDEEKRLIISRELREYLPNDLLKKIFLDFEGHELKIPDKFLPSSEFLAKHRQNIFIG